MNWLNLYNVKQPVIPTSSFGTKNSDALPTVTVAQRKSFLISHLGNTTTEANIGCIH